MVFRLCQTGRESKKPKLIEFAERSLHKIRLQWRRDGKVASVHGCLNSEVLQSPVLGIYTKLSSKKFVSITLHGIQMKIRPIAILSKNIKEVKDLAIPSTWDTSYKLSTHWPHVLALLTGRRFRDKESWFPDPGRKDWGVYVQRKLLDVIPLQAFVLLVSS